MIIRNKASLVLAFHIFIDVYARIKKSYKEYYMKTIEKNLNAIKSLEKSLTK